jgi:DNA-binding beta-propeller fold protein YncE
MSNDKDFKVKKGVKPTVYHEKLGTVVSGTEGYTVLSASYDSVSFSVAAQDTAPQDLFFKPDGTKMYIIGSTNDSVYEYNLSTAWDISTASYVQLFSVASQEITPVGLFFKPDGTKMYICGATGDDVNEFSLSTAWDISTASYVQLFSVASQETNPTGVFFKPDGNKMYITGNNGQDVNEYDLSTAWDISTASFLQSFSVAAQEASPRGVFFKPDGNKMYVTGSAGQNVNEYNLSTAWNISTASYGQNFSVAAQDSGPTGVYFKDDGTKMYVVGSTGQRVYQYSTTINSQTLDLSTGSVFQLTPASNIQLSLSNPAASGTVSGATLLLEGAAVNTYDLSSASYDSVSFSVASQEAATTGIFFKPDGLKMYIVGTSGDDVNEYNLSTAWDVSTASYLQVFSVSAQEASPNGIFFKPDGTKMYITGGVGVDVNEYNLSTAWNVSTASFVQNFSVSGQDGTPTGIFFKPDGTKMYVAGASGDEINEYSLSTAWNISTASFVQVFSVAAQVSAPRGVFFKPDGTKMYFVTPVTDDVSEYSLSTAWNISTASYVRDFSVAAQETGPTGLFFKDDGTKMYVVGDASDTVFQYSTATSATIIYDSSVDFPGGTAPTSPAVGDTDVLVFTTRDGGTSYKAALAIDGAA